MVRRDAPGWTDHDVSDPGVTLLEVLVYVLPAVVAVAVGVLLRRRSREVRGVRGVRRVARGCAPTAGG